MSAWAELSAQVFSPESWQLRQLIMTYLHVPRVVGSLDETVCPHYADGDGPETTWADKVCIDYVTPEMRYDKIELRARVNEALTHLSERERFIILWHTLGEGVTLEEIGMALEGISRERVRQIEVIAKAKLRWWLNRILGLGLEEPRCECDFCHQVKGFCDFDKLETVRLMCRECGERAGKGEIR